MSKSAVAKASTIVYFGPSDTLYCRVGSIDANETVEVHAKELTYYYITYPPGSTKKRGFVPDGIYTGFLSDEKQADKILKFIDTFAGEDTLILTDPVMGDDGAVYPIYTEELCSKMRFLVQEASVITPNLTEALLLLSLRR